MQNTQEVSDGPGFYPRPVVLKKTTWSNTTLWREVRAGRFPAPIAISSGRVAWDREAVDAWMRAKIEGASNEAA